MERPSVIEIKDLKIDYRNLNHFTIQRIIRNPAFKGGRVIHAVRGVDLDIREGEIIGIIGENGAGKSTLLKAIAGIFRPDEGTITIRDRRVSLMSLGVGFRHDLSGRENIMLAGLLLRYPASYIKKKTDEIIEFSELGEAIDNPVRTYSDGMYSKLGFAITAILETDVMLIDELLSVGDEHFQKKSFRKIRELVQNDHMTGVIVSHDMDLIRNICTRVCWMHAGRIRASGDPGEITDMYVRWSASKQTAQTVFYDIPELSGQTVMYRGMTIDEATGNIVNASGAENGELKTAVSWEPVLLPAGSEIRLLHNELYYRRYWYKKEIPPEWVYVPTASPDGCWMIYDRAGSDVFWQEAPSFCAEQEGWLRLAVCRRDGKDLPSGLALEDLFSIRRPENNDIKEVAEDLLERVETETEKNRDPGDAVFLLIADTHFTFGGIWEDTARAVRAVCDKIHPDGVVHLGDITDGTFPYALKTKADLRIKQELEQTCVPVYFCMGNHDLGMPPDAEEPAFLAGYPAAFSEKAAWYCTDWEEKGLRLIFLESYVPGRDEPYGYSEEELSWLGETLAATPEDYQVIIFSHIDPEREVMPWGDTVRNSRRIMEILVRFDRESGGRLLGVFCGHEHRDLVVTDYSFPIIVTGASKLEDKAKDPLHTGAFTRICGSPTQELFDVVIVKPAQAGFVTVRFGAGEDRVIFRGAMPGGRKDR